LKTLDANAPAVGRRVDSSGNPSEPRIARRRRWALTLRIVALLVTMTVLATVALCCRRLALWQVVQACVADFELTGASFPCLQVDLVDGKERGAVVLLPPPFDDMILAPTRRVVGVEDPFLQSPDAPNYFAAAWRARSLLEGPGGRRPDWEEIGLAVNPAIVRSQDQLHVHVGCLRPDVQRALASIAPQVPIGTWDMLPTVVPHIAFWGTRIAETDLAGVEPFRLAAEALSDKVEDRGILTVMVAGVRVSGAGQFLILASYAGAPHSWWPIGAESLVDTRCPPKPG
jgi:CDP-diacylglycerol pyrophosphatase